MQGDDALGAGMPAQDTTNVWPNRLVDRSNIEANMRKKNKRQDRGPGRVPPDEQLDESELHKMMIEMFRNVGASALSRSLEERRVARGRRLFNLYSLTPLWRALDQVLKCLSELEQSADGSCDKNIRDVAVLVKRARADVENAIDSLSAGVRSVVSDEMRDVQESELLLRLFAYEPAKISDWAASDDERLRDVYSAGEVRKSLADHAGLADRLQLPDTWEYEIHSSALHASPRMTDAVAKLPSGTLQDLPLLALEILSHSGRFIEACSWIYESVGVPEDARCDLSVPALDEVLEEFSREQAALADLPPRVPRSRAERRAKARHLREGG